MKQFFSDHYFQIGSTHYLSGKPCQDYALSGANGDFACAVVSDGCSTGRHTDVGARIQTLALIGAVKKIRDISGKETHQLVKSIRDGKRQLANTARISLGLSYSDMLATSVYAYLSQDGGLVHIEGDGMVVRKYKSGRVLLDHYEWSDNTPFYPYYRDANLESFINAHGGDLMGHRLTKTTTEVLPQGVMRDVQNITLEEGISGITLRITEEELNELQFIALFTDGAAQIEETKPEEAALVLTAFKNFAGEFAKRRMIRGLKDYGLDGRKVNDDIAVSVIRIVQEEEDDHDNGSIEREHQNVS